MSINGSNREHIFSIYLKENPIILENVLDFHLQNLQSEQRLANRNFDLKGIDPKRRVEVLIEIQLTPANFKYMERIKGLIEEHPEAVIIWIARSFQDELIKEVVQWLDKKERKYNDFYAIQMNEEVFPVLDTLNQMDKNSVYYHFNLLQDIKNPLTTYFAEKRLSPFHCGVAFTGNYVYDWNRPEDLKRALLEVLQKRMPYFLNFHFSKKMNQHDRILMVGAGCEGLSYRCSPKDSRSMAFVEIFFDELKLDLFKEFKKMEQKLREEIDPRLEFRNRRIGVYFRSNENFNKIFSEIAGIFERMIQFFSPFVISNKIK
jgi:hypothetical protein